MRSNRGIPDDRRDAQARFEALVAAVGRAIHAADPAGLLKLGAPDDEYAPEVRTIVPRLVEATDERQVQQILHDEFVTWFSDNAGPESDVESLARRLWVALLAFRRLREESTTPANIETVFRSPTREERRIIDRLLEEEFPGRDELKQQATRFRVRRSDENGSLEIQAPEDGPRAPVRTRVPVEAEFADNDGVAVYVLLHVVNGLANELEVYRADSGPVQSAIDPDRFDVMAYYQDKPT